MSFINPKKQSEHTDYDKTNNGGTVVSLAKGLDAQDKLGTKNTQTPGVGETPGVNKTVVEGDVS